MARSVLLVDDDPTFRVLAAEALRGWGHDPVWEASTAAAALAEASRRAPDTALVDICLPDGDGYTLASALAALDRPPRIVLISGDSDAGNDTRAQHVGAVAFVAKPELFDGRLRTLIGDA